MKLNLLIGAAALVAMSSTTFANSPTKTTDHDARTHSSVSSVNRDSNRTTTSVRNRGDNGPTDQGRNTDGSDEVFTPNNDGNNGVDDSRGSGTGTGTGTNGGTGTMNN